MTEQERQEYIQWSKNGCRVEPREEPIIEVVEEETDLDVLRRQCRRQRELYESRQIAEDIADDYEIVLND